MNGISNCTTMSRIDEKSTVAWPVVFISRTTSSGVTKTPIRLENDALTIAPATFPLAIEVNAIED